MVNKKKTLGKHKRHKQMSIDELAKMTDNTLSNIVPENTASEIHEEDEEGTYKILLQDAENHIDTYIIDNTLKVGGIAVPYNNKVMIILGTLSEDDKIISKEEFNENYEIYEKY